MAKNKVTSNPQVKPINSKELVGPKLAKILKLKRRFIDLEMKKFELSRTQWQVLVWMRILGPSSQKELLKNIDIDAAHLARVLEEFEEKKYILRKPIKDDRRCLFIEMTDYTKQHLVPHIEMALQKKESILLHGLTSNEKKQLNKILQKLEVNMESALKNMDENINDK